MERPSVTELFMPSETSPPLRDSRLTLSLAYFQCSKSSKPNFIVSKLGHIAYKKAAILLGVEIREINTLDSGEVNIEELRDKIDEETFIVVGLAGTTALGNYDDIREMDRVCAKAKVPVHIDAAIGGFIYPFRENTKIPSNFRESKAIASVNISGHKYGYSRPSVGILLLKNSGLLSKNLYSFSVPYLIGKDTEEFGLLGSKPAIGVIDLNYNVTTWGEGGYTKIVEATFRQKNRLISKLKKIDQIEILDSKDTPIFLVSGREELLLKISKDLEQKGLYGKVNTLFKGQPNIRIVVRKHFDNNYIDNLFKIIEYSLK